MCETVTSPQEPAQDAEPNPALEVWVEVKRGEKGVSISVYQGIDGEPVDVLDETFYTWQEFTGIDTYDLPISRSGTTRLEATPDRNHE